MSGTTMQILPRTMLDFTSVKASGSQTIWIAQRIPYDAWREGTFYIRFHPGTSISVAPTNLDFLIYADGHTMEEPAATDQAATVVGFQPALLATLLVTAVQGGLIRSAVPANAGAMLAVAVYVKQASPNPGIVQLMMSVDLSVKD